MTREGAYGRENSYRSINSTCIEIVGQSIQTKTEEEHAKNVEIISLSPRRRFPRIVFTFVTAVLGLSWKKKNTAQL